MLVHYDESLGKLAVPSGKESAAAGKRGEGSPGSKGAVPFLLDWKMQLRMGVCPSIEDISTFPQVRPPA